MGRFVITVEFILQDNALDAFLPLMIANANTSREVEPGCDHFDVLLPQGERDRVFLYEIYRDKESFQAHLAAPHFKQFDDVSRPLIKDKRIVQYALTNDAGA